MNQLPDQLFPPLKDKSFDLNDFGCNDQSQYEEESSFELEPQSYAPEWSEFSNSADDIYLQFCPYCGHYVAADSDAMESATKSAQKLCLGHRKCVQNQRNLSVSFKSVKSSYTIEKGNLEVGKKTRTLGQKQYLLSSKIQHPLNCYSYFKNQRLITLQDGHLIQQLGKHHGSDSYTADCVVVPLANFHIKLSLRQVASDKQIESLDFCVDLSEIFVGLEISEKESTWIITGKDQENWTPKIQVQLIFDRALKDTVIGQMNFKYPHEIINGLPLVKINQIVFETKNPMMVHITKSAIDSTKVYSSNEDIYEEEGESEETFSKIEEASESALESNPQIEIKVFEPKTLLNIRTHSKTQNGSKEFQKKIRQMSEEELNAFIEEIAPYTDELICDDYANYMVQILVGISSFAQRYALFQSIYYKIPMIACSKQGTFALQQMISHMNTHEEFLMMASIMSEQFFKVATNTNGNHFLRKLIPLMPFYYNQAIFERVLDDFVELANNKNSVCVLKVILNFIGRSKPLQGDDLFEFQNRLIDVLTTNTDKVVKNEFGNYFVQEAFEVLGEGALRGVSELILAKFKPLSKEKFSSSVICKCINSFWKGDLIFKKLQSKLKAGDVLELFRNKEGNKVLLELFNSPAVELSFKNKIEAAIANDMPSKYNCSKWKNSLGSRTTTADSVYASFTEAMVNSQNIKNSPMSKKKHYNIQ